ncbi:MAG: prominin family protein [Leptospiraceae bacterium]|nr:prominin family protein [Leptospiraceae bacterium]NUM40327.1 hypothetical protein [Leptospiraceae bacterium]
MFNTKKKDRILANIQNFAESLPVTAKDKGYLLDAVNDIVEEISIVKIEKVNSSDIKLLILEMREGFKRVDERFASSEKIMNERFISFEKRFEAIDKRFEAVDKRFETMQWLLGLGFTFLTIIVTIFGYIKPQS